MLVTREAEVALAALVHLDPDGPPAAGRAGPARLGPSIGELAEAARVPRPFLAKVLQELAQKGLLRSKRGRTGGFSLGRPAREITLADVVLALDGSPTLERALPPLSGPADALLGSLRDEALRRLATTTLADLAALVKKAQRAAAPGAQAAQTSAAS